MLIEPSTTATVLCSAFLFLQSVIASEGASQPFEAQLDIARTARDHALCDYQAGAFLAGLAVAQRTTDGTNWHYRAYARLESFPPSLRESWARAAHQALTEDPPVPVDHFVQTSTFPAWWERACSETWVIGDHKFCRSPSRSSKSLTAYRE